MGPTPPAGGVGPRDGVTMQAVQDVLNRVLYVLMGIALTVIVACVAVEVFFRFALNSSLPWSGELATMGLVWMSLLGGSYAISKQANIRIEILVSFFPARLRQRLEVLTNLVLLALFASLFVVGLRYTLVIAPARTSALVVSQAFFYAAVPVSAAFMFLSTLIALRQGSPVGHPGSGADGAAAR